MAATPAISSSSSISTSTMQTPTLARTKFLPSSTPSIKLTPLRACPTSLSHPSPVALHPLASTTSALLFDKCSFLVRVSAADVEHADVVGVDQENTVVEEQQQVVNEGREDQEESAINTKLYFGNLPYSVDSAQLAGIIQDYGNPELIEVLYNRETGKSRGFAFVTMSNIEDCNAVIENLDGREFLGRILRVNFSDKPKPKDPLYLETEFKLFVGNLFWSATSDSLIEAFQKYGNVVGARVLYDGETGKPRGYGFVSFSTKQDMETALEYLNGEELEGRAMRVSLAQGKRN